MSESQAAAAPAAQSAPVSSSESAPVAESNAQNAPIDAASLEAAQQKASRVKKIKMSGKEREFNLDDDASADELIKLAQLGDGAYTKMQEAAEVKKKFDSLEKRAKEDVLNLLRDYGHDPEAMAEDLIRQKIEEMQKSPEQREKEQLQTEMEKLRKELESEKRNKQEIELQRLEAQQAQILDDEISSALEKHPNLPKEAYTVKRIAETLHWAYMNGFDDATVEDILPVVENEIKTEIQRLLEVMPEDYMDTFLGQKVTDKMRKSRLRKMKEVETTSNIKSSGSEKKESAGQPKKLQNARDFFKTLGR